MSKHPLTKAVSGPGAEKFTEEHINSPEIDFEAGRRAFIRNVGFGLAGTAALSAGVLSSSPASAQAVNDTAIFNFALNLEYLEAEFYLRASRGAGLADNMITGTGTLGPVSGGRQVAFQDRLIRNYANEISGDELAHVTLLRSALGGNAVARPAINLSESFTIAARAAGLITNQQTYDPFADDVGFILAAFIFEDVGVTAYAGAAALINDRNNVAAAAGILAVEAYHAGEIRTVLYARGLYEPAQKISDLRAALGTSDQGIGSADVANIVPTDGNALVARRTPQQVLNIVYGNTSTQPGLFFPNGLNGALR